MARRILVLVALVGVVLAVPAAARGVTDEDVLRTIQRAREYLINLQGPDGRWPEGQFHRNITGGHTAMALLTLVFIGESPNRPVVSKGLDAILNEPDTSTYVTSLHIMALAQVKRQLVGDRQRRVVSALRRKVRWLIAHQQPNGGWPYISRDDADKPGYFDFSNTQMAILALREASLAGEEIPDAVWQRALTRYFQDQLADGGWDYGNWFHGTKDQSYGSMTAAGLASVYICWDNLNPGSGCPCRGDRSSRTRDDTDRRLDAALKWLERHFVVGRNPRFPGGEGESRHAYYWLYSVERVGIAAGYKYFGQHDWYAEGAEHLVRTQRGGSWGEIHETCFAVMFLHKGRAPILFNKLQFDGQWNNHRRDIGNLTHYISKTKEMLFHWQIVSLRQPVEELHDAPVLFITAETVPPFTDEEKHKLRAFTDTGGTVLVEASCGNRAVRTWFRRFAEEVWPEWRLEPLGSDHGSYTDPYTLTRRPEVMGIHDGLRTIVFYAMDDISCPWHTKAYARQGYLFEWGINLATYATDHAPLRAKLAAREPAAPAQTAPVRVGEKAEVRVARVRHDGDWLTGRNYKPLDALRDHLNRTAGLRLIAEESGRPPSALAGQDVAYLVGGKGVDLAATERQALKQFVAGGGLVWAEAAGGALEFDQAFRKLCDGLGWTLELVPKHDPMVKGEFEGPAQGFDLSRGVKFRRALRMARLGRDHAELVAIRSDGRVVGLYSPLDVSFSATGYEAYACRGYKPADALAVMTNMLLYLTTLGS